MATREHTETTPNTSTRKSKRRGASTPPTAAEPAVKTDAASGGTQDSSAAANVLAGDGTDRFAGLRAAWGAAAEWMRAVAKVVWQAVRPVVSLVTLLGWIVLGAGVLFAVLGLVFGWIEFLVLALVLIAAFAAAIPFVFGRASYEVEIELNPRRVTVGDRALGRLIVRNAGDNRVLPTRMEFPVGLGRAEFSIPSLNPNEPHEELFAVPTSKRAVIPTGPARSVRGDQLGLLRRTVRWTGVIDLFVHPKTIRLAPAAAGILRDLEGITSTKITDTDLAFHALRPYEPGDDRRYVHWKTSARTGVLMVRQFQETRKSLLTVIHSLNRDLYANEDEFELGISVLASIVQQSMRDDINVQAANEDGPMNTRSITSMLDATSRFEPRSRTHDSFREFALHATRRLSPPTNVMIVAGSKLTNLEARQVEALFPQEVNVLVFRCDTNAEPNRTAIRDLKICTVTELEDLPKLMLTTGVV